MANYLCFQWNVATDKWCQSLHLEALMKNSAKVFDGTFNIGFVNVAHNFFLLSRCQWMHSGVCLPLLFCDNFWYSVQCLDCIRNCWKIVFCDILQFDSSFCWCSLHHIWNVTYWRQHITFINISQWWYFHIFSFQIFQRLIINISSHLWDKFV